MRVIQHTDTDRTTQPFKGKKIIINNNNDTFSACNVPTLVCIEYTCKYKCVSS